MPCLSYAGGPEPAPLLACACARRDRLPASCMCAGTLTLLTGTLSPSGGSPLLLVPLQAPLLGSECRVDTGYAQWERIMGTGAEATCTAAADAA